MTDSWQIWIYIAALGGIWLWYAARRRRRESRSITTQIQAIAAGHNEPVSLHPIVDANKCLGCGACMRACPEQAEGHILGLIGGKAHLVNPSACIGHGACKAACPTDAISLVFGTEKRGVTIPLVTPEFETTVPGVFIAGELGGMGLIRNALTQGREAIEAMHRRGRPAPGILDVVIVGAGPAGFGAAVTARSLGMRFVVIEQESLGGCIFQYPRGKIVMTAAAHLPLVGSFKFSGASKEELLRFWEKVEAQAGLAIRCRERMEALERAAHGFVVQTTAGTYASRYVLLAIGRRGTPRKLGVPGEDLPKVVYRLIDPEQYGGKRVCVVGGGDSALEAAASMAELGASDVTLSYRGEAFTRASTANRERVQAAAQRGLLRLALASTVERITPDALVLSQRGERRLLDNDAVIVQAGGVLPSEFLTRLGIRVETKYGTA